MPADQGPPPYEVLAALVASLRRELAESQAALAEARAELERARERIAELEARLAQSPRNSSRPPSSEGLDKPAPRPRSLRKKTGRKPGGQPGHGGTTLMQVARPDHTQRHEPGCCVRCGAGLAGRRITDVERRQVFDLPPLTVEVTEHQLIERQCACGHRTKAAAPPRIDAPVQYGKRVAAVIVYLYIGQFLSKKRTAQALAELFGVPLSSGTVAAITARAAGDLDGFTGQVRDAIAASDVAGFDETGFRVDGKLAWVHCARTGKYTLLMVHPKRGRKAIDAMGVLPAFAGVAVHDAWSPYDRYGNADHQLCCAHVLRELQSVTEAAPAGEWCWAAQAAGAITAMQELTTEAIAQGQGALDPDALAGAGHPLPLRRAHRDQPDEGPEEQDHEEAPRPSPPAARPAGRLPAVYHRPPDTCRQQRIRTRHQDGQAPAEGVRMPADNDRAPVSSAPSEVTRPPPPSTA